MVILVRMMPIMNVSSASSSLTFRLKQINSKCSIWVNPEAGKMKGGKNLEPN